MNSIILSRAGLTALVSLLVPTLFAGLVAWAAHYERKAVHTQPALIPFEVDTAQGLATVLDNYVYAWPPQKNIPALELRHFPPGMATLQVKVKKRTFFRSLLPLVITVNNHLLRERKEIIDLLDKARNTGHWPARLGFFAARYGVDKDKSLKEVSKLLLRRCNIVPDGLILAQAAKESGWGSSRFTLKANNLFGIHTWHPDVGVAASGSSRPQTDRIRSYPNLLASVRDYVHNLNVGYAYVEFREMRARQQLQKHFDSIRLARTLGSYSQLGETYIHNLQQLIAGNSLQHLRKVGLRPAIKHIFTRPALSRAGLARIISATPGSDPNN
ncbi:MAG TPA: glucosaminidase domain-containing protein [Gammaproteobacteria bacterium]|nr:glucosaminidase domain-containing protein [Gammaproteobacteria bacterium]